MADCIRCGYCCRRGSCPYGAWEPFSHRCTSLVEESDGRFACALYEYIACLEPPFGGISPAFGAGCCSSLNSDRRAIAQSRDRAIA